jgi:hypothetical protein
MKQAYQMIKAGQKREASQLLVDLLKTDRNNADAWWLLAHAATKQENAKQALQQVLRLRPNDANARAMLSKMEGAAPPQSPASGGFSAPPVGGGDRFSMSGGSGDSSRWSSNTPTSSSGMFGGPEPDDPFADSPFNPPAQNQSSGSLLADDDLFEGYQPANDDPFAAPKRSNAAASDPFGGDDPFAMPKNQPVMSSDPFGDNDPFGTPKRSSAPLDDPFGDDDPFAMPKSQPIMSSDPFGDNPFGGKPSSSSRVADDPFGSSDPFADDPFAGVGAGKKGAGKSRPSSSGKSGGNPVVVILAIIGVVGLIGCAACGFFLWSTGNQVVQFIEENATIMPDGSIVIGTMVFSESSSLPTDLNMRGGIDAGRTVRGTLSDFNDDGWTFQGTAGQTITLELNAISANIDPTVYIYNPDGSLLGQNDDIDFGSNTNSRLVITLPTTGTYTIVAGQFGFESGDYELRVLPN